MRNYFRAFCFWLGFLAIAVTCGIIREKILIPLLGAPGGTIVLLVTFLGPVLAGKMRNYSRVS